MSPEEKTQKPARIRTPKACNHCRQRKVKCNGNKPCQNCTRYQITCQYSETPVHKPRKRRTMANASSSVFNKRIRQQELLAKKLTSSNSPDIQQIQKRNSQRLANNSNNNSNDDSSSSSLIGNSGSVGHSASNPPAVAAAAAAAATTAIPTSPANANTNPVNTAKSIKRLENRLTRLEDNVSLLFSKIEDFLIVANKKLSKIDSLADHKNNSEQQQQQQQQQQQKQQQQQNGDISSEEDNSDEDSRFGAQLQRVATNSSLDSSVSSFSHHTEPTSISTGTNWMLSPELSTAMIATNKNNIPKKHIFEEFSISNNDNLNPYSINSGDAANNSKNNKNSNIGDAQSLSSVSSPVSHPSSLRLSNFELFPQQPPSLISGSDSTSSNTANSSSAGNDDEVTLPNDESIMNVNDTMIKSPLSLSANVPPTFSNSNNNNNKANSWLNLTANSYFNTFSPQNYGKVGDTLRIYNHANETLDGAVAFNKLFNQPNNTDSINNVENNSSKSEVTAVSANSTQHQQQQQSWANKYGSDFTKFFNNSNMLASKELCTFLGEDEDFITLQELANGGGSTSSSTAVTTSGTGFNATSGSNFAIGEFQ